MLALIVAVLMQAAPPAAQAPAPAPTTAAAPSKPPAKAEPAVDANGVPAWAKRKRMQPVQNCQTKPNIGVETWRQDYDSSKDILKPRPPAVTCHH